MPPSVQLYSSNEIDTEKWDHCVETATNGLIYSTTAYLHALTNNWHGLVVNDYQAVMPLPWRKKMGFKYFYTPPFVQQLGLTGQMDEETIHAIIIVLNSFAVYGDMHFNYSNDGFKKYLPLTQRTNLLLDLSQEYGSVKERYSREVVDSISVITGTDLLYGEGYIDQIIGLYSALYGERMLHVTAADHTHFSDLCALYQIAGKCIARSVKNSSGEVICGAVLLKDNKRLYNIINVVMQEGRQSRANYYLYDQLIREFSGQQLLLDFEGSELAGVKQFYKKFGAVDQPYFHYHYNRLPWPLRLLKK